MNVDKLIVAKFGGTSLPDSKGAKQVVEIINANPDRRVIVVSAPGERFPGDIGVTDLLELLAKGGHKEHPVQDILKLLSERYREIADGFGIKNLYNEALFDEDLRRSGRRELIVSRGEYRMGHLLAWVLKSKLADPARFIRFNPDGSFNMGATRSCWDKISESLLADGSRIVVPGFYGMTVDGEIKLFPRGGSDITMAVMAILTGAKLCEKFTDVDGIHRVNPQKVRSSAIIPKITWRELRELSYGDPNEGILHHDTIARLANTDISVQIRHTNKPKNGGTLVAGTREFPAGDVVGIAYRYGGFVTIDVEQTFMHSKIGAGRRILSILEDEGISFDHISTGMDNLVLAVEEKQIKDRDALVRKLHNGTNVVEILGGLSLLVVVGEGMAHTPGIAAKVCSALAEKNINIRLLTQGGKERSIVVGVDDHDFESAINAVYDKFFRYK